MSLPTNTWISISERYEIPREKDHPYFTIEIDITDGEERVICSKFSKKDDIFIMGGRRWTPTHFMIIELPK